MDRQIDLTLQQLLVLSTQQLQISQQDYLQSPFNDMWSTLQENETKFSNGQMVFKSQSKLFVDGKLAIPDGKVCDALQWSHASNGHPGSDRTVWFFLRNFYTTLSRKDLLSLAKTTFQPCATCLRAKPNTATDRGSISALSIPQVSNDVLFIDFISMDPFNNYNYILTIVDSLTRFAKFIPTTKNITGEGVLKLIQKEWISHYDKPKEIFSDNDVRFASEKGFYQEAFKAMGIQTHFSIPRHPQSNGLCERINRSFIQNVRVLSLDCKTIDWPKLTPFVSWIHNSQVSSQTGFSPSELFLGRSSPTFSTVPEVQTNPSVENWLHEQLLLQEKASKRLQHLREKSLQRSNRGRPQSTYTVGEYVLIHKKRWPQMKIPKLESPWLGPFKIQTVHHNSLKVLVSPSLGGLIQVAMSMVRKWYQNEMLEESDDVEEVAENQDERELNNEEEEQSNPEEEPQFPEFTEVEAPKDEGYYNVKEILKHKFRQGWRFLVHWENYPISASTWEPVKAFVLPNGAINMEFKRYCEDKGLTEILQKVITGRRA